MTHPKLEGRILSVRTVYYIYDPHFHSQNASFQLKKGQNGASISKNAQRLLVRNGYCGANDGHDMVKYKELFYELIRGKSLFLHKLY